MSITFTPAEILEKVSVGKPFTLLLLLAGNPVPDDTNLVNRMQLEHLAHLFTMEHDGKACIFGPISNDEQLHGIIIFNTTNKDDIRQWMSEDPYIKAGHLTYELYDWFTIPGQKIPE
ncbi:MAG: YciI family protein [Flavisolibacter sp.]|jgi:uncharacterized protein YciI